MVKKRFTRFLISFTRNISFHVLPLIQYKYCAAPPGACPRTEAKKDVEIASFILILFWFYKCLYKNEPCGGLCSELRGGGGAEGGPTASSAATPKYFTPAPLVRWWCRNCPGQGLRSRMTPRLGA